METPENKPGFFQSNTARMIMVGLLTIVLMLPLALVDGLIQERAGRQMEVVSEINDKWGESVYCYGPILQVPYTTYQETVTVDEKTKAQTIERTAITDYAYFFPNTLNNTSSVQTKLLKRNNYESVVYSTKMAFMGDFTTPDFSAEDIAEENIHWEKASILIKTTNLKSIKEAVKITLGDKEFSFRPVYNEANDSVQELNTGYFDAGFLKDGAAKFAFSMTYNGSQSISMVPVGKTTTAQMTSDWASPSFTGNYLPADDKTINEQGFSAHWKILDINRPFQQQSFGKLPDLRAFAFAVDFVVPVDEYQQNERAVKYGFLMIGLTFLIFFLIQTISKIKIHIFQYSMIGLALIMFYTLLISITEHSSFLTAYLVAGTAVVAMITLYSISILRGRKFPLFIGGALTVLYSFIYVIIQLENYALLFGSIGLFAILGAVMYFSRKIEWH